MQKKTKQNNSNNNKKQLSSVLRKKNKCVYLHLFIRKIGGVLLFNGPKI